MSIQLEIPYLDLLPDLAEAVERLEARSVQISQGISRPTEWYSLRDAWEYRGGAAWSTFKAGVLYQPRLGIADAHQQGRRVWHKSTIERWALVCDETRLEYIEELLTPDEPAIAEKLLQIMNRVDCPDDVRTWASEYFKPSLTA